jgi:hypothetical protein
MTPHQLITWTRVAAPGESVVYYTGRHTEPPEIFHTARKLAEEGRVMLYCVHNQWCARKISSRVLRFLAKVSAMTDRWGYPTARRL